MGLPQIEIQNLNAMQFSTATNQHEMVAPTYLNLSTIAFATHTA